MGVLAVDITVHGVVMSADSQRIQILGGENRVESGDRRRNPIVVRTGGGFVGLVGFAGTERIDSIETAEWLRRFGSEWPEDDLATFCNRLAVTLTDAWQQTAAASVLEILVAGEVAGDVQFWYVRNSTGLRDADWKHEDPEDTFICEPDLDKNYISQDRQQGETKEDVLRRTMYSFRQGVLLPAAPVFDAFGEVMGNVAARRVEGFAPLASLDEVGHFARVRMEFLKRLCTAKYGIYATDTPTPIGGVVHVFGVGRNGEIREYAKGRNDVVRPGRT